MTEEKILRILGKRAISLSQLRWRLRVSYDELWEALRNVKDEVDLVPYKSRLSGIMVRRSNRGE